MASSAEPESVLPAAQPRGFWRNLVGSLRALASRGASADALSPDDPAAALVYVLTNPDDQKKPRTLITYLGAPPENIGEIIASVAIVCQRKGEYPVAVMSELRPDVIATSAIPIEFIPTWRHLPFGADVYSRYVHRRWSLMLAKWNFAQQIDLDMHFDDFVEDQLLKPPQAAAVSDRQELAIRPGPAIRAAAGLP